MEKFWGPFKELVDDKTESVDRSEATGARELGTDPKSGKPVSVRLGRYGPYAQIGTTRNEEKPSSPRCVRASRCTRSRWPTRWSCSSCRASSARATGMKSASASAASGRSPSAAASTPR